MNRAVSGAYTVELKATSTNKFYFPEIPQLRNKKILHIDTFGSPKTMTGRDVIPSTYLYMTLVASDNHEVFIENFNVPELSDGDSRILIDREIDFQRSYFVYNGNPEYDTQGKSILVTLWYEEPALKNFIPEGGRNKILPLQIKLSGQKTFFSENLNFRDAAITSLFIVPASLAPDGSAIIVSKDNKFLTLSYKNIEFIHQLPLWALQAPRATFPLKFDGIKIDLQKSFIETLTTTADDLKTVLFNVVVDDSKQRR